MSSLLHVIARLTRLQIFDGSTSGEHMIDFGLDDPAVAVHFDRALLVIQDPITELAERLNAIERVPASTELYRLHEGLADGPLRLDQVLFSAAEASVGSLQQIARLVTDELPTSPIVFQTLMRTALVGAARVVYVLLPSDPELRSERAAALVAQDLGGGIRGLKRYVQFEGLAGARAPEELLDSFRAQRQALGPSKIETKDGATVDDMTAAIAEALISAAPDEHTDENVAILQDEAAWLWNTYSGLAHGHAWPRFMWTLSGDRRIPGDFAMDLHHVATCAHFALVALLARCAPQSAGETRPVNVGGNKTAPS